MQLDEHFTYPPLEYLLMRSDHPGKRAWSAATSFANTWNAQHQSQFSIGKQEITLQLAQGVRDVERVALLDALNTLERTHGCVWIEAATARYDRPETYVNADYVGILGDGCPPGFVANDYLAWSSPVACPHCGRKGSDRDRRLLRTLTVNERVLAQSVEARRVSRPDILMLYKGELLISQRTIDALRSFGARGWTTTEVFSTESPNTPGFYALLSATTAIVTACPIHSPTQHVPCAQCGRGAGTWLGSTHLEAPLVKDLDMVSLHPSGFDALYVTRELYKHLESSGITGLFAVRGIDRCHHAPVPERENARVTVSSALPTSPAPQPRCTVTTFLNDLRSKRYSAHCELRGTKPSTRVFSVESMIEPGADPAVWNALERSWPDAAHLRSLALQADGVLLFYQSGARPSRFPTRTAIYETQGEVCVAAALQFEKSCDWSTLREQMQEELRSSDTPFGASHGVPFATIVGSSHQLVCADGQIYYYSPLGSGRFHNQIIANDLEEFLGIITHNLARFLLDGAAVTNYFSPDGQQYTPTAFVAES